MHDRLQINNTDNSFINRKLTTSIGMYDKDGGKM